MEVAFMNNNMFRDPTLMTNHILVYGYSVWDSVEEFTDCFYHEETSFNDQSYIIIWK